MKCEHGNEGHCYVCDVERKVAAQKESIEEREATDYGDMSEKSTYLNEPTAETALTLRPGEDIEVRSYHTEALKLLDYAEKRVIKTLEDSKTAVDDLSIISTLKKSMEGKKKEYLEPLKIQTDAIRDTYNYLMLPVLEAERITKEKQILFLNEQKRIQQEQERINQQRREAAEAEMKLTGELSESLVEIDVAEAPRRVLSDLGSSGLVDSWKWKVVDMSLIPREYLVVDNVQLTAIARRHHNRKPILGIEFYNDPYLATRR